MKLIIAGTRDLHSSEPVHDLDSVLRITLRTLHPHLDVDEVVCGDCRGVDRWGKMWAQAKNVSLKLFPADWDAHGRAAGPIRNREMAEYADALLLIWDGHSRGSASMLKEAERQGLIIHQVRIGERAND